jgi:hypothetical protein
MLLEGEYGTNDAMTCEKLDQIFIKTPEEVIKNGYLKNILAHFILTYGRCAANQEHINKLMKKEQRDCFIKDPEEEKKNAFKCYCDFLTKSDLAFVRYQFDNSEPDWKLKRENPENKTIQYGCKTKHTSGDRAARIHGGYVTTKKGMEVYEKAMKFFVDLKKDPNYDMFLRYLNSRAKVYGILKTLKIEVGGANGDGANGDVDDSDDEEQLVVPTFDLGEDDLCAGFAAV